MDDPKVTIIDTEVSVGVCMHASMCLYESMCLCGAAENFNRSFALQKNNIMPLATFDNDKNVRQVTKELSIGEKLLRHSKALS